MISQDRLVDDFRKLGLHDGDALLVHASLSRIGRVEGGAQTVIDALRAVLGDAGTLLMPTFQGGAQYALLSAGLCFDVLKTASELGIISETFRKMPGVRRSLSPTHSVSALGPLAEDLLNGHEHCRVSTGHASPFEKLAAHNGKILLLGVDHSSNTTLHYVENTNGAPTLSSQLFTAQVRDAQGVETTVELYSHMPAGLKRHYPRAEQILLDAGIQRNGYIGEAESRLIESRAMIDLLSVNVRSDPMFFIEAFQPPASP